MVALCFQSSVLSMFLVGSPKGNGLEVCCLDYHVQRSIGLVHTYWTDIKSIYCQLSDKIPYPRHILYVDLCKENMWSLPWFISLSKQNPLVGERKHVQIFLRLNAFVDIYAKWVKMDPESYFLWVHIHVMQKTLKMEIVKIMAILSSVAHSNC